MTATNDNPQPKKRTLNPFTGKSKQKINYEVKAWDLTKLILCGVILFFLVFLAFQAMHVYAELGRIVGDKSVINFQGLGGQWISDNVPLVGPFLGFFPWIIAKALNRLQVGAFGLIAIMGFLVIQMFEVLPTVIKQSPDLNDKMVSAFDRMTTLEIYETDSPALKRIKLAHNNYFPSFIEAVELSANLAFLVDLAVCFIAAPVIVGGYGNWDNVRFTFGWDDLAWTNIIRIFITLWFFNAVVWVYLQVRKGIKIFGDKGANNV